MFGIWCLVPGIFPIEKREDMVPGKLFVLQDCSANVRLFS
jgi:hypothetical protein